MQSSTTETADYPVTDAMRQLLKDLGVSPVPEDRESVYREILKGELHAVGIPEFQVIADSEVILDSREGQFEIRTASNADLQALNSPRAIAQLNETCQTHLGPFKIKITGPLPALEGDQPSFAK